MVTAEWREFACTVASRLRPQCHLHSQVMAGLGFTNSGPGWALRPRQGGPVGSSRTVGLWARHGQWACGLVTDSGPVGSSRTVGLGGPVGSSRTVGLGGPVGSSRTVGLGGPVGSSRTVGLGGPVGSSRTVGLGGPVGSSRTVG